ncbi:MAG TPA: glycosyltransferase [Trichocoleus sp.]|jgi:glycosyltransferase involved in cell wall biosynthesis
MKILMMPDYRSDNPYQSLLAEALQDEGVEVCFPQNYKRIFPISRLIKSQPFNVLHLHWFTPYLKGNNWLLRSIYSIKFLLDVLIAKWLGVKVVWTVHNRISHESPFPRLEWWTQQTFIRLVDRMIVHHKNALEELAQSYDFDHSKVDVLPHGHYRGVYGTAIDPLEARKLLDLPATGRIYLHLGMLRPYKGIEHLLEIWQENQVALAGNTLLIAGKALDENYRQVLESCIANCEGVIWHPGFVDNDRISLYFSATDVVVLPFKSILTSGSLILAMSYGKPIIAPKISSIVETLGQADRLLYNPQDEQGLLHSLKDSTQVDLGALSQLVIQECDHLNWDEIGKKTRTLYQSVLE